MFEESHKERIIQEFVPGKQVTLAHVIPHPVEALYAKMGLIDAEGAIGIFTITPSEAAIIAADVASCVTRWDLQEQRSQDRRKTGSAMDQKMKRRIIMIGRSMAGKTTLCQYLSDQQLKYKKTQAVEIINKNMIDTPGEYLERTYMRGALMVSAADADTIVLVQDATENGTMFPPGYSSSFAKPCIGVVTKSDKATEKQLEDAQKYLKIAGAKEIFVTSSYEGTGFEPFLKYFEDK